MNRFYNHYNDIGLYDICMKTNCTNTLKVPGISKIILNMGVKDVVSDKRRILPALLSLEMITGQRALITKSRKPLMSLKIRKGMVTGCKVVLRKNLMYNFLDKFITITLPRIKNFNGFQRMLVTNNGNISFRIKEPLSFFELEYEYDKFRELPPLDVTLVTTGVNREEGLAVLSSFQFPFVK